MGKRRSEEERKAETIVGRAKREAKQRKNPSLLITEVTSLRIGKLMEVRSAEKGRGERALHGGPKQGARKLSDHLKNPPSVPGSVN